ncbi:ABC-2 type transport system ATP-binding protein [Salsuginibacillus halophilus]|uniref:ABC-2 type transport system ATP-binding protein n=1 Tax=Salsuginibacillus halophilus TaxID=517424 RepID=A0A2P8HL70_9BACI|nr:ABC transporter ATP-binding protein [Salsuginibacillus halophilus]PSL46967.1 ABC-2 type transport system ATP-binding protein [Salsuginibacillus halophilus]
MNTKVDVRDVSLNYRKMNVIDQVSFTMETGKTYGLIGRNGAGKTTLLSLLTGFRLPDAGDIQVNGEPLFENRMMMPKVNLIYPADYADESDNAKSYFETAEKYRPHFDRAYAEELAEKFGFPVKKPINKLSTGMQSAFNATLGLAARTEVTLFDEVYNGMDAPTREAFYQEFVREQERHPRIMVLSTHLVSEMDYLFDHVFMLHNQKLIADAPTDELQSRAFTVTGGQALVDEVTKQMAVIHEEELGGMKRAVIYDANNDVKQKEAAEAGLGIGAVTLQDLFIYLTGGGNGHE